MGIRFDERWIHTQMYGMELGYEHPICEYMIMNAIEDEEKTSLCLRPAEFVFRICVTSSNEYSFFANLSLCFALDFTDFLDFDVQNGWFHWMKLILPSPESIQFIIFLIEKSVYKDE